MSIRCHNKFYTCLQIFNYNPESIEHIHLAQIELKTRPPKPLSDPYTNIVFQPTACASAAHTKTNRWCGDQIGDLGSGFGLNFCQMDIFNGFWVIIKYLKTV